MLAPNVSFTEFPKDVFYSQISDEPTEQLPLLSPIKSMLKLRNVSFVKNRFGVAFRYAQSMVNIIFYTAARC